MIVENQGTKLDTEALWMAHFDKDKPFKVRRIKPRLDSMFPCVDILVGRRKTGKMQEGAFRCAMLTPVPSSEHPGWLYLLFGHKGKMNVVLLEPI